MVQRCQIPPTRRRRQDHHWHVQDDKGGFHSGVVIRVIAALLLIVIPSFFPTAAVLGSAKLPAGVHRPRQELGQSYLSDPNTAVKIAEAFNSASLARFTGEGGRTIPPVVELGPGLGALTRNLVTKYPYMMAVEIDGRAVGILRRDLPQTVQVLQGDMLEVSYPELASKLGGQLHVVGNLPYSITTKALLSLVATPEAIRHAVVMVQKEAAERIWAPPGSNSYGVLSVMMQAFTKARRLFNVAPTCFYPPPKVTSTVLELDFFPAEEEQPKVSSSELLETVQACFAQRKRVLRQSLKTFLSKRCAALPPRWAKVRAEQMRPSDFVELHRDINIRR
eukprot:TRINITY_DN36130_c0_g1_i1.p1 TRINITY_DN36130_c0_g1~~TRINITY_DN36130_c0_g1_i1.p1  ORF type:complete len:335 (+),score=52.70 TRINITY_DN36130_c0_g1_i1:103-1107(+)